MLKPTKTDLRNFFRGLGFTFCFISGGIIAADIIMRAFPSVENKIDTYIYLKHLREVKEAEQC